MSTKNPATDTPIEFPLRLVSELKEVTLANDAHIRPMDDATRLRLFGIESVELDSDGRLKSYIYHDEDLTLSTLAVDLDDLDQLYSSNFVVALPSQKDAADFNFALKLLGTSCSSLYIGFRGPTDTYFVSPCYYGKTPLTLGPSDVATLSRLLALKRGSTDARLALMAEKLLYALSEAPRSEGRFVELSIILEMLLLPSSSAELSYRFALRMAKLLAKHCAADPVETFKSGQQIYKTRSRLVHSGQDPSLADIQSKIEECVRLLLTIYVTSPELFEDAALDSLCISG